MEMVKLVKGDRIIERRKIDYDNKKEIISTKLHYYHGTVKLKRVIKLTRKESEATKV